MTEDMKTEIRRVTTAHLAETLLHAQADARVKERMFHEALELKTAMEREMVDRIGQAAFDDDADDPGAIVQAGHIFTLTEKQNRLKVMRLITKPVHPSEVDF